MTYCVRSLVYVIQAGHANNSSELNFKMGDLGIFIDFFVISLEEYISVVLRPSCFIVLFWLARK